MKVLYCIADNTVFSWSFQKQQHTVFLQ